MDLSKYVFHSINCLNDGCCVLVGDLIITAGHVVSNHPLTIAVEGTTYDLYKEDALFYKWDGDNMPANSFDIAIFRISDLSSPIEFDISSPCKGMILKSISYEHRVENAHALDIFSIASNEHFITNECDAVISAVEGNFFQCKTDIVLKPGSSGSPVFRNGKVFGILHGGQPGQPYCFFQSSASILDVLSGIKGCVKRT